MDEKSKGYILIVLSGVIWGTTGLCVSKLMEFGLKTNQIALVRMGLGFLVLFIYALLKDKSLLKINKKVFIHCVLIGLICQAGFNFSYFKAVDTLGVSMAAILLYSSPLFLAVFSKLIYKERLNKKKLISLAVCFIGCILAVTGGDIQGININGIGIVLGLLSAITYALMPIISKGIVEECNNITILIYGFLIGIITMLPLSNHIELINSLKNISILPYMLALGCISGAGAYICYINGISKGVELSIAGILASGELIVAVLIGWTLLGENFAIGKLFGIVLMILSGIISVKKSHSLKNNEQEDIFEC